MVNTIFDWGVALERWLPVYLTFFGIWRGIAFSISIYYQGVFESSTQNVNIIFTIFLFTVAALDKPIVMSYWSNDFIGSAGKSLTN